MADTDQHPNDTPVADDTQAAEEPERENVQETENEQHTEEAAAAASEDLEKTLAETEEQRDQFKDALIRERADFENYKKRNAALAATSFDNGVESALTAVLPVLDNFERALAAECADKAFADGMQMIMRQLQTAMEGLGVEEIDTAGEFDPTRHHAVLQTEDPELGPNAISETLQKGYTLKGKVLRPAMVKVNK